MTSLTSLTCRTCLTIPMDCLVIDWTRIFTRKGVKIWWIGEKVVNLQAITNGASYQRPQIV